MKRAERNAIDRMLLSDPLIARALAEQRFAYYQAMADNLVDHNGDVDRLVDSLQRAGLPVSRRAMQSYWSWQDRHVYDARDSATWVRTSARRLREVRRTRRGD